MGISCHLCPVALLPRGHSNAPPVPGTQSTRVSGRGIHEDDEEGLSVPEAPSLCARRGVRGLGFEDCRASRPGLCWQTQAASQAADSLGAGFSSCYAKSAEAEGSPHPSFPPLPASALLEQLWIVSPSFPSCSCGHSTAACSVQLTLLEGWMEKQILFCVLRLSFSC